MTTSSSLPSTPLVTVPLRPCCPNCFSATESAALQGDNWTETFSPPVRRRRSVSSDNRPCPPHLVATTSGTTPIQWSPATEKFPSPSSPSPPSAFRSVVVDEKAGHMDEVVSGSGSDGQSINKARKGIDHLSVRDPRDDVLLSPLLPRHKPWLSPIPSNNPSVDDLSPKRAVGEEVDSSPESDSVSAASSSPTPATPSSSVVPTPTSSPTMSYAKPPTPTKGRGSSSPSLSGSFRIPKRAALLRAGSDILKGVSVLGSSPV